MMVDPAELRGDVEEALDFLRHWGTPWVLTAIDADSREIQTQTFAADQEKQCAAFIGWWMGKRNLYFSVNRPRGMLTSKAEKKDIETVIAFHVDIDPLDGEDINAERTRIYGLLSGYSPPPSIIINSGGGLQGFWLLKEPIHIDDPAIVEAYNRKLEEDLGGDHCHNIDRIMRLPGTINIPNEKKRGKGRLRARAMIMRADWTQHYEKEAFTPAANKAQAPDGVATQFPRSAVPEWCERVIIHGPDPKGRYHYDGDRSKAVFAVCCALVRSGWSDEDIVAELLRSTNGISAHIREQTRPEFYAQRQAQKARLAVGFDFTRTDKHAVIINQANIRLAFAKLGVVLMFDAFARRMLIEGPDGKPRRHLDNKDSIEIHLLLDELWQMRVKTEYFNEIIENEANRNTFHPVVDYLDGLRWDGERRIDTWLVMYAGAKDIPYVRAIGAIILIAAVRRVRQPGCKFDEMIVFESSQGLEKSSGLAALAVNDSWFTDSLPLNADDKTVIEQLSGRWIAEAPELKGMRKGDVEHLKAFLSRQVDRARMSYARFVTEAPRQCIIFGTTNADTYLRDMTGNRRFWPLKIKQLLIDLIRRDRDQLWAEAAAREAAGESIRLDPKLYRAAAVEQNKRLVDDPWVQTVQKELGVFAAGKILIADLWGAINLPAGYRTQEHNARLGETMRALGWDRVQLRYQGRVQWHYAKGTAVERQARIYITRSAEGVLSIYQRKENEDDARSTEKADNRQDAEENDEPM